MARREPMKPKTIPPAVSDAIHAPAREPAAGLEDRTAWLAMSGATAAPMLEAKPPAGNGPVLGPVVRGQRRDSGNACKSPCGAPVCLAGCRRRWPAIL